MKAKKRNPKIKAKKKRKLEKGCAEGLKRRLKGRKQLLKKFKEPKMMRFSEEKIK